MMASAAGMFFSLGLQTFQVPICSACLVVLALATLAAVLTELLAGTMDASYAVKTEFITIHITARPSWLRTSISVRGQACSFYTRHQNSKL